MLRFIALLSLCVSVILGAECDSCCDDPPPSDECSMLEKKLLVLENTIEEAECDMDMDGNEDLSEMCEMLVVDEIPACLQHEEEEDADECLDSVSTDDIVKKCQCKNYEELKEDLLDTIEDLCDERDSKHHLNPVQIAAWSNLWQCGQHQRNRGSFQCQHFFQNGLHFSRANAFLLATGNTNVFLLNQALRNRGITNSLTTAILLNRFRNRGTAGFTNNAFTNAFIFNRFLNRGNIFRG